jgi:hypothetical protein
MHRVSSLLKTCAIGFTSIVAALGLAACSGHSAGAPNGGATPLPKPVDTYPPVASTPVPPPAPGDASQTVPAVEQTVLPAIPLSATATPIPGISIALERIATVDAQAHVPGEVSGPAAQITVDVRNDTDAAVDIESVGVDLTDSAGEPGIAVTTDASNPFAGSLDPGASATGVYVFRVPTDARNPVLVTVSYTPGATVAQFTGKIG